MIDTKEVWRKINSTDPMDHIDLHATIMTLLPSLLNRLEVAESDCLEQARLNGMGASREASLQAKSEAAEKERDNANAAAVGIALQVGALQAECDKLCTKIAAMEKQEPMELNYIELLNSAQKSVESYVYFRRFIASTPLENDIAIWMVDFVFAQLNAKGE